VRQLGPRALDVEALLECERDIAAIPADLRARAVRRARRAIVEGHPTYSAAPSPTRLRWAVAAVGVLALGALSAAAIRSRKASESGVAATIEVNALPSTRASVAAARIASPQLDLTSFDLPPRLVTLRPTRRAPTQAEEYTEELRLLQPAREAIARDDFVAALAATAAHGHRFPRGRLAEEREALRIVALAGARRGSEARAAARSFHDRFPHSLLQRRVEDAVRDLP
jgi:hypothetical protein